MILNNLLLFSFLTLLSQTYFRIPIHAKNRKDISYIHLTDIGKYSTPRKERKNVPSHLHTGIDIKRPDNNYDNEPIYSIADGIVISKREDGPYAQIIIEHCVKDKTFWTTYEHISGITVSLNEHITTNIPIAHFMNKMELNKYGWQFDHFHFEIIKEKPIRIKPDKLHPERHFKSFSLVCHNPNDLEKYFYDPIAFFNKNLN